MKIEDDTVTFSSGRQAYANNGIIGLSPRDGDVWSIRQGYDAGLWYGELPDINDLTTDDICELADDMIALWGELKTSLK